MAVLLVIFVPKIMIAEDFAKYSEGEQEKMIRRSIESSMRTIELQKSSIQGLPAVTSHESNRRESQYLTEMSGEISSNLSHIRVLEEGGRVVPVEDENISSLLTRNMAEGTTTFVLNVEPCKLMTIESKEEK